MKDREGYYAAMEAIANEPPAADQATHTLDEKHGEHGWDIYRAHDGRWICNIKGEESFDGETITEALVNGAAFNPLPRFRREPPRLYPHQFGRPMRDGSRWVVQGVAGSWNAKKRAVASVEAMCERSKEEHNRWCQEVGSQIANLTEGVDFRWE